MAKIKDRRIKRRFQDQIMRDNMLRSRAMKAMKEQPVDLGEAEEAEEKKNPGGMDYSSIMEREREREREGSFLVIKDAFKKERRERFKNRHKIKAQKVLQYYQKKALEESHLQ